MFIPFLMIFPKRSPSNSLDIFLLFSLPWRNEVTYWICKFGKNNQTSWTPSPPLGVKSVHWDPYCSSAPPGSWPCGGNRMGHGGHFVQRGLQLAGKPRSLWEQRAGPPCSLLTHSFTLAPPALCLALTQGREVCFIICTSHLQGFPKGEIMEWNNKYVLII